MSELVENFRRAFEAMHNKCARLSVRIADLEDILETVPHFHDSYQPLPEGDKPFCARDCPRCAYERLKGKANEQARS